MGEATPPQEIALSHHRAQVDRRGRKERIAGAHGRSVTQSHRAIGNNESGERDDAREHSPDLGAGSNPEVHSPVTGKAPHRRVLGHNRGRHS